MLYFKKKIIYVILFDLMVLGAILTVLFSIGYPKKLLRMLSPDVAPNPKSVVEHQRSLEIKSTQLGEMQSLDSKPKPSQVSAKNANPKAKEWVKRSRRIEQGELRSKVEVGELISFSPFPDVKLNIEVSRVDSADSPRYAYFGDIIDDAGKSSGTAFFSLIEGETGKIGVSARYGLDNGTLYTITGNADGTIVVEEDDSSQYPSCGEAPGVDVHHRDEVTSQKQHLNEHEHGNITALADSKQIQQGTTTRMSVAKDNANVLRLLVIYTDDVEAALGSAEAAQALVDNSVLAANQSYINSSVNVQLQLVHTEKVTYDETTFQGDLQRLAEKMDGKLDQVPVLRDSYQADLVAMLVENTEYCGMGYLMSFQDPVFSEYAYSVVSSYCASSMYSLAHEIGHNLGANHDHDNAASALFPYGFGHRFTVPEEGATYRTVMAYPPGSRIPYFSNPNVSFHGVPTGIPEGQSRAADVARALNEIAPFVAAYRGYNSITGVISMDTVPMTGIEVDGGSLGTVVTDQAGSYSFTNIPTGTSYTITPISADYKFSPLAASGTIYEDEVHDFTAAWATFDLSGVVRRDQTGIANVVVDGGALGVTSTDATGAFSFADVRKGTQYSLSFSKSGYSFSSNPMTGTLIQATVLQVEAEPFKYTISGYVQLSGIGLKDVTMHAGALGSVNTDQNGRFSFENVASETSVLLSPIKSGYVFSPSSVELTVSDNQSIMIVALVDQTMADDDDDGLTNQQEIDNGTSSVNPDTDGDGVTDGQEISQSTNPLDAGSFVSELNTTVCSEWNGFLGGMWNIMEHMNLSNRKLKVSTTLYRLDGMAAETRAFYINPGNEVDLSVHDLPSRLTNSVGLICSTYNGSPGDLDGRMTYYKHTDRSHEEVEFAFAMPFNNPLSGTQYVSFNTYQPSLLAEDSDNIVVNWLQLSNVSKQMERGNLYFYDMRGKQVRKESLSVKSGQRVDYPAHVIGRSQVGLVEWVPENISAQFMLRNVRYLYNNSTGEEHFDTAFQLEGTKGSGESIIAPVDTRVGTAVVEMSNTSSNKIKLVFGIHSADGKAQVTKSISLAPKASMHIIVNDLLDDSLAMVALHSDRLNSLAATVMQYGREENGGIRYMYGIPVRQALGTAVKGSYNTFLHQGCSLYIASSSSSRQVVTLSAVSYDATQVITGFKQSIPGNGVVDFDLCAHDQADRYGVVTIQGEKNNTLYATVVRKGQNDTYRFPTPVR